MVPGQVAPKKLDGDGEIPFEASAQPVVPVEGLKWVGAPNASTEHQTNIIANFLLLFLLKDSVITTHLLVLTLNSIITYQNISCKTLKLHFDKGVKTERMGHSIGVRNLSRTRGAVR